MRTSDLCARCQHNYGIHSSGVHGPCRAEFCVCPHFVQPVSVDDAEAGLWA